MDGPLQVHLEAYPVDVQIIGQRGERQYYLAVLQKEWNTGSTETKRVPGPVCVQTRPSRAVYKWPTKQLETCMEGKEGPVYWLKDSNGNTEISTTRCPLAVQLFGLVLIILFIVYSPQPKQPILRNASLSGGWSPVWKVRS